MCQCQRETAPVDVAGASVADAQQAKSFAAELRRDMPVVISGQSLLAILEHEIRTFNSILDVLRPGPEIDQARARLEEAAMWARKSL